MRSPPPDEPCFLLDSCLSRYVAVALRQVRYNIQSIDEVFGRHDGVLDPDVIEWVQKHNATWINADLRAKSRHRAQIITSQIRVLWVRRTGGTMSPPLQLAVLSYALFNLRIIYQQPDCPRHFLVHTNGLQDPSRIRLERVELLPTRPTKWRASASLNTSDN